MDTDIIVSRSSPFDRLLSGFGKPDPTDLDRLAASLNDLALSCREPAPNKAEAEATGEQRQRPALPPG